MFRNLLILKTVCSLFDFLASKQTEFKATACLKYDWESFFVVIYLLSFREFDVDLRYICPIQFASKVGCDC